MPCCAAGVAEEDGVGICPCRVVAVVALLHRPSPGRPTPPTPHCQCATRGHRRPGTTHHPHRERSVQNPPPPERLLGARSAAPRPPVPTAGGRVEGSAAPLHVPYGSL